MRLSYLRVISLCVCSAFGAQDPGDISVSLGTNLLDEYYDEGNYPPPPISGPIQKPPLAFEVGSPPGWRESRRPRQYLGTPQGASNSLSTPNSSFGLPTPGNSIRSNPSFAGASVHPLKKREITPQQERPTPPATQQKEQLFHFEEDEKSPEVNKEATITQALPPKNPNTNSSCTKPIPEEFLFELEE